jgi:hypothetical protein
MKITRSQLKKLIKEEINTISETSDDSSEIENPSEFWGWNDADNHSADDAEEAGMRASLADNKVQIKLKAAMDVLGSSFPILDALYRHGLGNMTQPEEQAILARHLAAASDEVMANKHWNKPKN